MPGVDQAFCPILPMLQIMQILDLFLLLLPFTLLMMQWKLDIGDNNQLELAKHVLSRKDKSLPAYVIVMVGIWHENRGSTMHAQSKRVIFLFLISHISFAYINEENSQAFCQFHRLDVNFG